MGLRGNFTRSNLADANERCDWRLYCEFAQALIRIARKLYATEPLGLELDNTVYALAHASHRLSLSVLRMLVTQAPAEGGRHARDKCSD